MADTVKQYREVVDSCRELFLRKLGDYSPSWRILRLTSVTDQILNKAKRIRQIGESGVALVNEGVEPEFVGLVNYSIIGLIQLELGPTLEPDLTNEEARLQIFVIIPRLSSLGFISELYKRKHSIIYYIKII